MSIQAQFQQAQNYIRNRNYRSALEFLRPLLSNTHVNDYEYDEWLRAAVDAYIPLGEKLHAAYINIYLGYFAQVLQLLTPAENPMEVARCYELQKNYSAAARLYLEHNKYVHAAVNHERAQEYGPARAAWETLLARRSLDGDAYLLALLHLNLGLCCQHLEDKRAAHEHFVISTRHLEEIADEFEARGAKDRAFDCYQVLLKIGKEAGSYENLAEGYLNSIRVLKDDNLKFYVLQYFEDFQRLSMEREEFHAAATLFREAAEYCSRMGMIYDRYYESRAAEAWWKAAEANIRKGGPPELSENALLACVDSYNQVGDYYHVKKAYEALAALPLGEKKKKRYEEITQRYDRVQEEPVSLTPFPDYLRQPFAYADIWYADLLEWEQDGDPLEVAASLVGNPSYPDIARRHALRVILQVLDARTRGAEDTRALGRIAESLGQIQAYAVLSPLEKLGAHPEAEVRAKAVGATRTLFFKRSFVLVRKGLSDEAPEVRAAALQALSDLHFTHAFEPLSRIYREYENRQIRKTVLRSIGRIPTMEAGEFLLEVLRYESDELRTVAADALRNFDHPEIFRLVESQALLETGDTRTLLQSILNSLRGAVRNGSRGF